MFDSLSNKIEIWALLILTLFAFSTETYWIHWATAAGLALTLLIIDVMFMNESDFIYDPDYNHWKDLNETKDFQFKTD